MDKHLNKRIVAALLSAALILPALPMAEFNSLTVTAMEAVAATAAEAPSPAVSVAKIDGTTMTGATAYDNKPWNNTADGLTNTEGNSIFVFDQEFKEGTIEFTMTTGSGDNGVIFGLDGDSMDFWESGPKYYFVYVNNTTGELILAKTGDGMGWCWMKSMPAAGFSAGTTINVKVEYDGDGHICMYTNGTLVYDYCDAHPLTGTRVGVRAGSANVTYTDFNITTTNDGPDSGIAGGIELPFAKVGNKTLTGYYSGGPWQNDGSSITVTDTSLVHNTWATTFIIDNDNLPLTAGSLTATVRASSSVAQSDNWLTGIVFGVEADKNVTVWKRSAYSPKCYVLFVDQNKKLILSKAGIYNEDDRLEDLAMTGVNAIDDYEIGSSTVEIKATFVTNDDGSLTIRGYANGVQLLEYTDTDPCTGSRYGFAARCAGSELTSLVPVYNADSKAYSKGLEYESNGNGTCIVTGIGSCTDTDIVIPSVSPEGDMVTSIGGWAFEGCRSLTSIKIPDSVTLINNYAFYHCISLTSIEIPNSVTSIGMMAFYNCSSLTSIKIPDSVTSIDNYAFQDCSSLTSVVIGNGVTEIGSAVFTSSSSLESITVTEGNTVYHSSGNCLIETKSNTLVLGCKNSVIPINGSVTSIGDNAFEDCSSLTSIEIPDSVISIGDDAFRNCSSLTSIEIPNSVTSIGDYAFSGCDSLTSVVIGDGVTSIGEWVLRYCSSLTNIVVSENNSSYCSVDGILYDKDTTTIIHIPKCISGAVVIPDGVISIGDDAFRNCSSLTSIEIPNSVTSIGDYAFSGCDSLTSIKIPDSVTSIDNCAFWECSSLTSVYITDIEAWCKISFDGSLSNPLSYANKLYLNGNLVTQLKIPNSATSISSYAFFCYDSLASINIPDSVTSIGGWAFDGCSSLTSITVSDGNTVYHSAGNCLIHTESKTLILGCQNSVIPNDGSVTSIGYGAFDGCSSLTSIEIPDSVTAIDYVAFMGCSSLTSVVIGDGVTTIGDGAFDGCSSLTSIEIPDSITSIGVGAFSNCYSLIDLQFSDSVKYINQAAFANCTSLTSVIIPSGVLLGDSAFSGCTNLKSLVIEDGVLDIWYSAFGECNSLEEVVIPNSVTWIGRYAFYQYNEEEGEEFDGNLKITILNPECELSDRFVNSYATICGYAGSTAETYAEENGNPFIALPSISEEDLTVDENKVTMDSSDADENILIPSDIITNVAGKETTITTSTATITFDTAASDKLASADNIILNVINVTTEDELTNGILTYTITLISDGKSVLPVSEANSNGKITVSVLYLTGLNLDKIKVTYIGEDGTTEDIPVVAYDPETGIVTFTTTHLSRYEISSKAGIPGDTDGSGKVNMRDIALIQQYLNGKDVEIDLTVADVDGSGKINMRDAALIQQYLNGKDVELK